MNNVILTGKIVSSLEFKDLPNCKSKCIEFDIRTKRKKDKDKPLEYDDIKIVAWGKTAENIKTYCWENAKILISGCIQVNKYTAKNEKEYSFVQVNASFFELCERPE